MVSTIQQPRALSQSFYTINDGQRFAGTFELANAKLSWRSGIQQSFLVDLEKTHSIGPLFIGERINKNTDTIFLVNNDQLDGFIESIDSTTGATLEIASKASDKSETPTKEKINIPIQRISEIQLATKIKNPTGWRFWLSDGSVVDADSWTANKSTCQLTAVHTTPVINSVIPWNNILSIAPNPVSITNLASCPWKIIQGTDKQTNRLAPPVVSASITPAAFDAIPMDFYGPGVFEFSLGQNAATLIAVITVPPQLKGNIECRVSIEDGEKALLEQFINPESGPVDIRIPILGNKLVVRLDQSKRGAFGCAIRLEGAMLISQSCGAPIQTSPSPANAPAKSDM